ncbi:MAG: VOC family protein [Cyanothece sp. SIO1E1]|nr:VOC family protein [Cyanothece sp. SIO1E1]
MHGNFIWVDLTTFDVATARGFYRKAIGWEYESGPGGYQHAIASGKARAGIYKMPAFFERIKMPSFWMTYIEVEDIDTVVEKANELGGKVEKTDEDGRGKIALIRDPLGAGFTCYEGNELAAERSFQSPGAWAWSELFVSDLSKVRLFYASLFGWTFKNEGKDRHSILNEAGDRIGAVQVASNEIKGEKEFWAAFFSVSDLEKAKRDIAYAGGKVIYELNNPDGLHLLCYDDQGAAFFVTEAGKTSAGQTTGSGRVTSPGLKWRSLIGLLGIYFIVLLEQDWAWGVLFLFWVIPDLKSGVTYFIEAVDRRTHPLTYWAIVLTWLGLAAYMLIHAGMSYS